MKKTHLRDQPDDSSPRPKSGVRANSGSQGPWEFNTVSQGLMTLGSTKKPKRAAYLTASGELRFLPL